VQSYEQLVEDPQVDHNGLFWEVPVGDDEATFLTPASPITFSATPTGIQRGVPRSGQHTAEVLGESSPWES
jgi:crotonobetainyl-CoA:carnitine CoA-transferase CaiB-like acyl-CoA transferase